MGVKVPVEHAVLIVWIAACVILGIELVGKYVAPLFQNAANIFK